MLVHYDLTHLTLQKVFQENMTLKFAFTFIPRNINDAKIHLSFLITDDKPEKSLNTN